MNAIEANQITNNNCLAKSKLQIAEIHDLISEELKQSCNKYIYYSDILTDYTKNYFLSLNYKVGRFNAYKGTGIGWDLDDIKINSQVVYDDNVYTVNWIYCSKVMIQDNKTKDKLIVNESELKTISQDEDSERG